MVDLETLKAAGLTEYEAKCYVALLRYGTMKGSDVAEKAEIPKTRVYDALDALTEKGLASKIQERPMKFSPIEPKEGLKPIFQRKKNKIEYLEEKALKSLNQIDRIGERKEVEEQVDMVLGKENMFSHAVQRVEDAKDELWIFGVGNTPPKKLKTTMAQLVNRGVDVRFILSYYGEENEDVVDKLMELGVKVRVNERETDFSIGVMDGKLSNITVIGEERVSLFLEVEGLSQALREYYLTLWDNSKNIEELRR